MMMKVRVQLIATVCLLVVFGMVSSSQAGDVYWAHDYDYLQDAIDAAGAAGGGIVICEAVTYNEAIVIDDDNITLMGSSGGTIIDGGEVTAIKIESDDIVVKDISVQTDTGTANYRHGVQVTSTADRILLQNVHVIDCDQDAFVIAGNDVSIISCRVTACERYGVLTTTNTRVNIVNSTFHAVGIEYAFYLKHDYGQIIGNWVCSGSYKSIRLTNDSSEIVVDGNYLAGGILSTGTGNVIGDNS